MMQDRWMLIDGEGRESGPYTTEQLQGFHQTGLINHESLVWSEGLPEWVKAGKVENLLPERAPAVNPVAQVTTTAPVLLAVPRQTVASPAGGGGVNFGPQNTGLHKSDEIKGWLSGVNLATCLGAVLLFFLPWLEMGCSQKGEGMMAEMVGGMQDTAEEARAEQNGRAKPGGGKQEEEKKPEERLGDGKFKPLYRQTGLDTLTGNVRLSSEVEIPDLKGASANASPGSDSKNVETSATPVLVVFAILVGIAAFLSILVVVNRSYGLWLGCQTLSILAAGLLALQMSVGFPLGNPAGGLDQETDGMGAKELELVDGFNEMFEVRYTIWLKLEMALLASSLVFLVVGRVAGRNQSSWVPHTQSPAGGGMQLH